MLNSETIARLESETALMAYLDLANMFGWQGRTLKWRFNVADVIRQLQAIAGMKEVKVYYGLDEREPLKSLGLHARIRKAGAILRTKPVKHIRKTVNDALMFKRTTLDLFDDDQRARIHAVVEGLQAAGVVIEEKKCNFDVEITMDILDDMEKASAVMLFSGDSDFAAPLERLKVKGKRVYVVGVRGQTASELFRVADQFINFGQLYQGKKYR